MDGPLWCHSFRRHTAGMERKGVEVGGKKWVGVGMSGLLNVDVGRSEKEWEEVERHEMEREC